MRIPLTKLIWIYLISFIYKINNSLKYLFLITLDMRTRWYRTFFYSIIHKCNYVVFSIEAFGAINISIHPFFVHWCTYHLNIGFCLYHYFILYLLSIKHMSLENNLISSHYGGKGAIKENAKRLRYTTLLLMIPLRAE